MQVLDHLTDHVDRNRDALVALSHAIHADAEVGFEEHTSSGRVADALRDAGYDVTHGAVDLPTSVVATIGSGPLTIGICAEYDALPGIGHACGHNIIAAAAVGAASALAEVADELGVTVRVLGTPSEEGGGGKILMMERGAFDGLHAAMMVHPAPYDAPELTCLAVRHLDVTYEGRAAHASAFPQQGVNAADALTVAQVAIGLLRQHIRPTDRIHGIVTHGGDAPNIVPGHAEGTWFVRSATLTELHELYPRVQRCFEAGALATGATLEIAEQAPPYSELLTDQGLLTLYLEESAAIGRDVPAPGAVEPIIGSTDMGNVSLVVPSIHPMVGLDAAGAVNHQPEFAAACVNASADAALRDGALAMARTVARLATEAGARERLLERDAGMPGTDEARGTDEATR